MARKPTENETSSQPNETETEAAPSTVRVYSLAGYGRDEVFGVAFVNQLYADVAPDLAQRMVEFRPEVVTKDADGNDVITRGDDPLYSLEAPTPKA